MPKFNDEEYKGKVVLARLSYCHGCQTCFTMDENDKITQHPHIIAMELESIVCDVGSPEDIEHYKKQRK